MLLIVETTSLIILKNMEGTSKKDDYKCEQCPKVFTMKKNLDQHIRNVHEDYKPHQCGICQKRFSRKQNKELHLKTCAMSISLPKVKKTTKIVPDIKFFPVRISSSFNGIATEWIIIYPNDYRSVDPIVLLQSSVKAMKDIILKQLHEQTKKLKFTMSIHVVFAKAINLEVKTIPSVVLTTSPSVVYIGTDLDHCLHDVTEELFEMIETFEGNGSGWIIDYLERLDTAIYSF